MGGETAGLEVTLRNLNIKIVDATSENKYLHNDKLTILRDITGLNKEKENLSKDVGGLRKKVADANKKINEGKLALAKDRAPVDQQKARNAEEAQKNSDVRALIETENEKLENKRIASKETFAKLLGQEGKNNKALNDLKQRESKHSDNVLKFNNKEKAVNKKEENLDIKKDEVIKNLEEAKSLKAKYEDKIKETEHEKAIAKATTELASKAEENYKQGIEENKKKEALLEVRDKNLDQRGISLGKKSIALQENEDVFEVKRLRLEKAEKSGTVKEELKKLREELEPK